MHIFRSRRVWACSMEPVKKEWRVLGRRGLRIPDGGVLCTCLLILSPGVLRSTLSQI